jgi:nicotinamide riboside kinase
METPRGLIVAVLGAESTGKTTLAPALAERIARETGLACTSVAEVLREWCDREGRTPRRDEQAQVAAEQQRRIEAAAARNDVVVTDTAPLQTAVYSRLIFGDRSLETAAAAWHAGRVAHTLLTALDLPWVADGHQRDGEHVRAPVDATLRELLAAHGIAWSLVSGTGPARVDAALDALAPLLRRAAPPGRGLFTRLAERDAQSAARAFTCELCDEPDCEHRLRQRG